MPRFHKSTFSDAAARRLASIEPALRTRASALKAAREFFEGRGFLEVHTPVRVAAPALELNIEAIPTGAAFLRTSPELHMKRLLAAGYRNVFQIGPCFRQDEKGALHNPEFTMLEWYRAEANYMDIMEDTKALLSFIAESVLGGPWLDYRGTRIVLNEKWHIETLAEIFSRLAGWNPVEAFDPDRFDMDLVEKIEPALPLDRPAVLKDFPAAAAALARIKPDDSSVAERWELYMGRVEIANAFSELVDWREQRCRFEECAEQRRALDKPVYEIDEDFMAALEGGLPACAGAALGFDRLVMLLCDSHSLDEILPFR